jgi:hypothetical protein
VNSIESSAIFVFRRDQTVCEKKKMAACSFLRSETRFACKMKKMRLSPEQKGRAHKDQIELEKANSHRGAKMNLGCQYSTHFSRYNSSLKEKNPEILLIWRSVAMYVWCVLAIFMF